MNLIPAWLWGPTIVNVVVTTYVLAREVWLKPDPKRTRRSVVSFRLFMAALVNLVLEFIALVYTADGQTTLTQTDHTIFVYAFWLVPTAVIMVVSLLILAAAPSYKEPYRSEELRRIQRIH